MENIEVMLGKKVRPIVQEELSEVKEDTKIIKKAVQDTNGKALNLQQPVTSLESV